MVIITTWRKGTLLEKRGTNLLNGLLDFALDYLAFGAKVEHANVNCICLFSETDSIFFDGTPEEIYVLNECMSKYLELWNVMGEELHDEYCDEMECAKYKVRGALLCQTEKIFARCAVMYALGWKEDDVRESINKIFHCEDFKKFVQRIEILDMDAKSSLILVDENV